ncbi:MAG: ABC transporter ATP-binding protein [Gaiellaceae bacterium]
MTALAAQGLSVAYGGQRALADVTFSVETGTWAALIGPNGAGKSSLLRAVAGLTAHSGRVELIGVDADAVTRRDRAKLLAFVAQTPLFPPAMTVAEYVLLGRTPHIRYFGSESRNDRTIASDSLRALDLEALADRAITSLSGGERQRAVIARALTQQPQILLLDEPTTGLDLGRQQEVLEIVDDLRRSRGITVVAAMHDLSLASQFAGRMLFVAGARLVAAGPPRDVLQERLLRLHFGESIRVVEDAGVLLVVPVRKVS